MRSAIGKIHGSASSFEFEFVITNSKSVKRGDYIKVWNDKDGWVLGQVSDILAVDNPKLSELYKVKEVLIAKARVLGKREAGKLRMPTSPFIPGDNVYIAEDELIAETFGFAEDGAYIGLLGDTSVKVKLNPNTLVQKHVCILAKTGSGKSYTAGVIMEELLERNVPLLIIDPHGEYVSMKKPAKIKDNEFGVEPKGYADKIIVYAPPTSPFIDSADKELSLDGVDLTAEELIELSGLRSPTAQALLYQALRDLKNYTIADIIKEVESIRHSGKWTLIGALSKIEKSGLFKQRPTDLRTLLVRGKASLIDLRGIEPAYQNLIVSRVISKLFELRKRGEVEPGMIVVEEAHNFAPEREKTVSSNVLRTVASEGRKFGLGLMVISQRPARIDKNVISQCNTQIILRVTNPNDINAIKKGIEGITAEMVEEIKRLPTGSAVVVSPELEVPVIVRVRVRRSQHSEAKSVLEEEKEEIEAKEETAMEKKEVKEKEERKGFLSRILRSRKP
ncbi:MAG: ATP-binding protein [Archaeoglobales archaeon]|nr:ATP-binding protein [Archaeoglobales archaeon]